MNLYCRIKTDVFKHFWGKYVRGFDINQHCVKCLEGPFSAHFFRKQFKAGTEIEGELSEHEGRFFYLCGVTSQWVLNVHIAVHPRPGRQVAYEDPNVQVLIDGAEQVPIVPVRTGRPKAYEDCRNWQFGYAQFYEPTLSDQQGALL